MSADLSAARRLCTACAMCCDGTLFHYARLQPCDSAKALAALGIKLKRKRRHDCLLQPCQGLRERRCTIYAARPERCRLFECAQLKAVLAGGITEEEAGAKIREARRRVERLGVLLAAAGERTPKGPLGVRFEKAMASLLERASEDGSFVLREELKKEMGALEILLDREFRLELVTGEPESAEPAEAAL